MRVFGLWDTPSTAPFRTTDGITISMRGGDICHPLGQGDWLKPPYFSRVWRWYCPLPILPWVTWRFGNRGGYAGFKCYGADSDAYKNWMRREDVYPGSQALQISIRPFATIDP